MRAHLRTASTAALFLVFFIAPNARIQLVAAVDTTSTTTDVPDTSTTTTTDNF
eukprot:m.164951 g.164951  ORF g.164951 m.164951 type:complete len:53 (+) comp31362_c0_seq3:625-783(+)